MHKVQELHILSLDERIKHVDEYNKLICNIFLSNHYTFLIRTLGFLTPPTKSHAMLANQQAYLVVVLLIVPGRLSIDDPVVTSLTPKHVIGVSLNKLSLKELHCKRSVHSCGR
jgi:hypothetical protein